MTVLVPKAEMLQILNSGVDVVQDLIVEKGMFTTTRLLIFRKNGNLYRVAYREGMSETPFEFDGQVACQQVEAFEKTITITDYRLVS